MNSKHYRVILHRELKKLKEELEAYPQEEALWLTQEGIQNSAGTLAVHLLGSLRTYIGKALGKVDYQRNKEAEFKAAPRPRQEILAEIDAVLALTKDVLDQLDSETIAGTFPQEVEGQNYPTELILHHVLAHVTYHLGQINYHRRLLGS
ncbi:MAG: DinB family protein [Bacteroidota bacterium]